VSVVSPHLPALIGRAPVIRTWTNPGPVSAIQVPGINVWENRSVAIFN
jgi:hypothetical protein